MGFIKIPDWAARGVLHPREFAVYAALLSRADAHTRECFPSYETLAAESGVTRRQVPYALAELIDEGLVERRRSRSVNRYRVVPFADDRPTGYRSRFERGERVAQRDRVREPHSVDDEQDVRVREPHSAEGGSRTPQSAGAALEPDPVELDPVEPLSVQRSAPHAENAVGIAAIDEFDRVWSVWPKKASKKTARAKFTAAAKHHPRGAVGLADDATAHALAYVQHNHPVQFVPMLSTWLNGDRWDDPLPGPRGRTSGVEQNASVLARYAGGDA